MIVLEGELEQFIICCFNKFSEIRKFWRTQTAATEVSLQVLSGLTEIAGLDTDGRLWAIDYNILTQ